MVTCVAVVAALGVQFAGHTQPGRLDAPVDAAFRSALAGHQGILLFLARFGDLPLVTVMTAALVLGCAVARRWRGALLAAIAVPVASGLTEGILKHLVGRTLRGWLSYPSGHATSSFVLATVSIILLAAPSRLPAPVRRLLMAAALLFAVAVPSAMVALGLHYFTDIVGGAAVEPAPPCSSPSSSTRPARTAWSGRGLPGSGLPVLALPGHSGRPLPPPVCHAIARSLDSRLRINLIVPPPGPGSLPGAGPVLAEDPWPGPFSRSRPRSPTWRRCRGRPGPSASGPHRPPRRPVARS